MVEKILVIRINVRRSGNFMQSLGRERRAVRAAPHDEILKANRRIAPEGELSATRATCPKMGARI